jgi:ribonucleoside-diphosphate reductase subunit M1
MHFHGWESGLKTGMYYLRTKPAVDAIKFTVDQGMLRAEDKKKADLLKSSLPVDLGSLKTVLSPVLPWSGETKQELVASPSSSSSSSSSGSFSRPEITGSLSLGSGSGSSGSSCGLGTSDRVSLFSSELAGLSKSGLHPIVGDDGATIAMPRRQKGSKASSGGVVVLTPEELAEAEKKRKEREQQKEAMYCSLDNKAGCPSCSS